MFGPSRWLAPFVWSAFLAAVGCGAGGDNKSTPPPTTYSISGSVGGVTVEGVAISLTGAASTSTVSDAAGRFAFTGLANGNYNLVPSKAGYAFSPVSTSVTVHPGGGTAADAKHPTVTTLERWYYAYRAGGLAALRPAARSDRGHAQELSAEQRQLILDIRKEHRSASVPLILRTLVADGRLAAGAVSQATVRRLYVEHGLDRVPMREGGGQKTRLRWEAASPARLAHGARAGRGVRRGRARAPRRS